MRNHYGFIWLLHSYCSFHVSVCQKVIVLVWAAVIGDTFPQFSLPPLPTPLSVSLTCIYLFLPTSCVLKVWTMCVLGHLGLRRAGKKMEHAKYYSVLFTTIEHIYISFHRHKHRLTHTLTQTTHKPHKHNIYSTEKAAVVFMFEIQKIHCGCKCNHCIYSTCRGGSWNYAETIIIETHSCHADIQTMLKRWHLRLWPTVLEQSCSGVCGSSKHPHS